MTPDQNVCARLQQCKCLSGTTPGTQGEQDSIIVYTPDEEVGLDLTSHIFLGGCFCLQVDLTMECQCKNMFASVAGSEDSIPLSSC